MNAPPSEAASTCPGSPAIGPSRPARWETYAFRGTGAVLVATSLYLPLSLLEMVVNDVYAPGPLFFSASGALAVGVAWSARAATSGAATRRWMSVLAAVIVALVTVGALLQSTPVDFEIDDPMPWAYELVDAAGGGMVGVVLFLASTWSAVLFVLKMLPFWGLVAHRAAWPGCSRWWLVAAIAPYWIAVLRDLVLWGPGGAWLSAPVALWLVWALTRSRRLGLRTSPPMARLETRRAS